MEEISFIDKPAVQDDLEIGELCEGLSELINIASKKFKEVIQISR